MQYKKDFVFQKNTNTNFVVFILLFRSNVGITYQMLESWLLNFTLQSKIAQSFPSRLLVVLYFYRFRIRRIVLHWLLHHHWYSAYSIHSLRSVSVLKGLCPVINLYFLQVFDFLIHLSKLNALHLNIRKETVFFVPVRYCFVVLLVALEFALKQLISSCLCSVCFETRHE